MPRERHAARRTVAMSTPPLRSSSAETGRRTSRPAGRRAKPAAIHPWVWRIHLSTESR